MLQTLGKSIFAGQYESEKEFNMRRSDREITDENKIDEIIRNCPAKNVNKSQSGRWIGSKG